MSGHDHKCFYIQLKRPSNKIVCVIHCSSRLISSLNNYMVERRALDPYSDALRLALLKFWIDLLSNYESTNSDRLIEPSFNNGLV